MQERSLQNGNLYCTAANAEKILTILTLSLELACSASHQIAISSISSNCTSVIVMNTISLCQQSS